MPGWIRRLAYRVASRVLSVYRFVRRPTVRGVRCALTHGDDVLLVRHTYGDRRWALPGGLMRRDETPEACVRREILEELALDLADYRALGVLEFVSRDRARHVVECFTAPAPGEPTADEGEIAEARWFPADALPTHVLDGTAAIVARATGTGSRAPESG